MRRRLFHASGLLLALALPATPYGCASMQQQQTQATEQLLTSAGFKARPADTPQKLAHLNTLQPFKLVQRNKDSQSVYTYADPEYCKCLYAGGSKEYQEFQRLKAQKQEAAQDLVAAEDSPVNWGMWGTPWW